jgi:hypothetical protein
VNPNENNVRAEPELPGISQRIDFDVHQPAFSKVLLQVKDIENQPRGSGRRIRGIFISRFGRRRNAPIPSSSTARSWPTTATDIGH